MSEDTQVTPDDTAPEVEVTDTAPEAGQVSEPEPPAEDEPQTFSADYVKQLREEAAAHRVKAKRTDEANERMVRTIAQMDGRLHDAGDVALSDDMLDESGIVDPDRVRESIAALIEAKPHLAKPRITTPMPMGVRQDVEPPPSLFSLVRERI